MRCFYLSLFPACMCEIARVINDIQNLEFVSCLYFSDSCHSTILVYTSDAEIWQWECRSKIKDWCKIENKMEKLNTHTQMDARNTQTDRQTVRQTHRHTDRHTDRHTRMCTHTHIRRHTRERAHARTQAHTQTEKMICLNTWEPQ